MADLDINEKYPNSFRLDHPDFGDVYKTTFAKGVIKEFEQLQDDPIKVASRVKVEVDGQESDFIPIFFHPKAQYWDDDEHLATDFNQDEKFFEKAWMSFRGDDEVVVMLREGEPFAVMGFYDGVPRIGENIIQSKIEHGYWWNCEKVEKHDDENGPDGKPLKLLKPCERIFINNEVVIDPLSTQYVLFQDFYDTVSIPETVHLEGDPFWNIWPSDYLIARATHRVSGQYEKITLKRTYTTYRYLMPVGPILYLIEALSTQELGLWEIESFDNINDASVPNPSIMVSATTAVYRPPEWGGTEEYPASVAAFNALIAFTEGNIQHYNVRPPSANYETNRVDINPLYKEDKHGLFAAPYTEELYDKAKGGGDIPSEFKKQTEFGHLLNTMSVRNHPDFEMFVRPHTKEELQKAGLWPKEV